MNKLHWMGNLGDDPVTRYSPNGEAFVTFRLANNYMLKDKEVTEWLSCSINGKRGDVIMKYCKKGDMLFVEGRVAPRIYQGDDNKPKATLNCYVDEFHFCGSNKTKEQPAAKESNEETINKDGNNEKNSNFDPFHN